MTAFIDEERDIFLRQVIEDTTALPKYENGVLGDHPDYIYLGLLVYEKLDASPLMEYIPTVALKFQSTYDDTYLYRMVSADYSVHTFSEVISDE